MARTKQSQRSYIGNKEPKLVNFTRVIPIVKPKIMNLQERQRTEKLQHSTQGISNVNLKGTEGASVQCLPEDSKEENKELVQGNLIKRPLSKPAKRKKKEKKPKEQKEPPKGNDIVEGEEIIDLFSHLCDKEEPVRREIKSSQLPMKTLWSYEKTLCQKENFRYKLESSHAPFKLNFKELQSQMGGKISKNKFSPKTIAVIHHLSEVLIEHWLCQLKKMAEFNGRDTVLAKDAQNYNELIYGILSFDNLAKVFHSLDLQSEAQINGNNQIENIQPQNESSMENMIANPLNSGTQADIGKQGNDIEHSQQSKSVPNQSNLAVERTGNSSTGQPEKNQWTMSW